MKIIEKVIKRRVWENKVTGSTASIYGAVPYTSEAAKAEWHVVTKGYTWVKTDGTIGLPRIPATTYSEAVEVMNRINNK